MNHDKPPQKYTKKYLNLKYNKIYLSDKIIKYIGEFKKSLCSTPEENKIFYKLENFSLYANNNKIFNPNIQEFWKKENTYSTDKKKISFLNNNDETIKHSFKFNKNWHVPTPETLKNIKDYLKKENIYGINFNSIYKKNEENKTEIDNKIKLRLFFKKIKENIEQKEDNIRKETEIFEKLKKNKNYNDNISQRILKIKTYIKVNGSYNITELYKFMNYLNDCIKYFISDNYSFVILKELKQEEYFNDLIYIALNKYVELYLPAYYKPIPPEYLYKQYSILLNNSTKFKKLIEYANTPLLYMITEIEKIKNILI